MSRLLRAPDFRAMPWANGKGQTLELARLDVAGAMLWRLSRAAVVENGAFSCFPEVERVLTVVSGPGFDLVGEGIALQARPYRPVAFPGDVAISALDVTEPSDDFNVMTARAAGRPEVRVLMGAEELSAGPKAVYWPEKAELLLTEEAVDFAVGARAILVRLPRL
jgi:environmental stress-induced protein Ves